MIAEVCVSPQMLSVNQLIYATAENTFLYLYCFKNYSTHNYWMDGSMTTHYSRVSLHWLLSVQDTEWDYDRLGTIWNPIHKWCSLSPALTCWIILVKFLSPDSAWTFAVVCQSLMDRETHKVFVSPLSFQSMFTLIVLSGPEYHSKICNYYLVCCKAHSNKHN